MAGQVIRRGESTWLVRIALGRAASGKRMHHNKTVKGTKKDAQRYLTKTLREMDTDTFVDASPLTLGAFLHQWLETAAKPRVRRRRSSITPGLPIRISFLPWAIGSCLS